MGKHCNCVNLQIPDDQPFTQYGTIIKQYQLPDLNWDIAEKGFAWNLSYIRFAKTVISWLTKFCAMKLLGEKTPIYTKLVDETVDYGTVFKTGSSKKYYFVPYSDEEKDAEWTRQRSIVLKTLTLCVIMITGGLLPLLI